MIKIPKNLADLTITETPAASYPFVIYNIANNVKQPIIYVAINDQMAETAYEFLAKFLPKYNILHFPAWDVMPYDRISPNVNIISKRINSLSQLAQLKKDENTILITTANALLTKVVPKKILQEHFLKLTPNLNISQDKIAKFLIANSYFRSNIVSDQGEFAIKGSLFDIFPLGYENPIRIDFFGDVIESIKEFDPITQISNHKIQELQLLPASEVILNDLYTSNFKNNYRKLFDVDYQNDDLYEGITAQRKVIGMEHWLPLFYDKLEGIVSYFDKPLFVCDQLFHKAKIERSKAVIDYYQMRCELTSNLSRYNKGKVTVNSAMNNIAANNTTNEAVYNPIPPESLYYSEKEIKDLEEKHDFVVLSNFSLDSSCNSRQLTSNIQIDKLHQAQTNLIIESAIKTIPNFFIESRKTKNHIFELLKNFLQKLPSNKYVIITAHNHITLEKIQEILKNYDLESIVQDHAAILQKNMINLLQIPLDTGFISGDYIFISEQDLLGTKIIRKENKRKKADKLILEASALSIGEFIVHKIHGIGQFIGLKNIKIADTEHDFITIEYLDAAKLYVPVENLDLITRFGSEQAGAKLDRLGSASFQERKARLKKRIQDIAADLIKIASEREVKRGLIYKAEEEFLSEFEAGFKFDATEDQNSAIKDVLDDLTNGKIMDRLICGDVGFGKTEIAMRAAFAVLFSNNLQHKPQIAVIVPTTLLARQHYKNFCERFAGFDCNIKQLSRMVTTTEMRKVKQGLADGSVDIVIGTHALLAKNISFKNLSLAIIDEEQHFGVKQKERIKEFKNNIHLLTLSATPIPRTLQMSLGGIKDMSILATPPVDRLAIRSFVMPFDHMIIRDAILREYYRGGRVFYVCPRIKDLAIVAEILEKLVPEVKIIQAHGGLKSDVLDKIMNDFCDGKYEVLLSTSIVESGIDIPEANTMIIHKADKFGLSALYQLRGRVGRSKIRAYAYFTFDAKKNLTPLATKRLEIMQTLDGLGAGFTLASHDLDIRGAGNLLGQEQSGHIKEVGAELYQSLLHEAIAQLKNNQSAQEDNNTDFSPQLSLGLSVLIPNEYIADINAKMEFYRRIAHLENEEEADILFAEMENRFGKIPLQVKNLIGVINLKNKCKICNIEKLEAGEKAVAITFFNNKFSNSENLLNYTLAHHKTVKINPDHRLIIKLESDNKNRIYKIDEILDKIIKLMD